MTHISATTGRVIYPCKCKAPENVDQLVLGKVRVTASHTHRFCFVTGILLRMTLTLRLDFPRNLAKLKKQLVSKCLVNVCLA